MGHEDFQYKSSCKKKTSLTVGLAPEVGRASGSQDTGHQDNRKSGYQGIGIIGYQDNGGSGNQGAG